MLTLLESTYTDTHSPFTTQYETQSSKKETENERKNKILTNYLINNKSTEIVFLVCEKQTSKNWERDRGNNQ